MKTKLFVLLFCFFAFVGIAAAADTTAAPLTAAAMPDSLAAKVVALITPIVVPLLIALVKQFAPRLPTWTLPLLAPVLGFLIGVINNAVAAHATNLWLAAALGLLGVAVREVKETLVPAANGGWPATPPASGSGQGGGG